jgi:hypothetical protein
MKEIETITVGELKEMARLMYGGQFVKAVVDVGMGRIVVDVEMHVDGEAYLLENASKQSDLWGINLYPDKFGQVDFVEFDSMVNIRPSQKNNSRYVEDEAIRAQIAEIISKAIRP